ncbi:MAG: SPOR domain-containing protein [Desulfovibrionaceae bacterium]
MHTRLAALLASLLLLVPAMGHGYLLPGYDLPEEEQSSAGGAGDYLVQVGSFPDKKNADHLARILLDKGYSPGVMTRIDDQERTWFMVYAGRYADRQTADAAMEKLRVEEQPGAANVVHIPTRTAARNEPFPILYAVQAGIFQSEAAALTLARQVKDAGFEACHYYLYDDADRRWFVVQIGDFADKKDAEAAAAAYEDRIGKAPVIKTLAAELLRERKQCP